MAQVFTCIFLKEKKTGRVLVNNKKMADKILRNVLQMEYLFEIDTIFLNEGLQNITSCK